MDQADNSEDHGEGKGSEGMTAEQYERIMDKLYQDLQEIIKRYEDEEISAEEYAQRYTEIREQQIQRYGVEELQEGQRQFIIRDIKHGREERREAWIKKYQEWYGRGEPIKDLAGYQEFTGWIRKGKTYDEALSKTGNTDFGEAMSRINAIPSEFEVMLFLRSESKILYDPDHFFTEWMNHYNGVDIAFMDPEEPEEGLTNLAGVDVKNTDNYSNFLIETEKEYGGQFYSKYAWAQHVLNGRNRYIAYVRGGMKYGGKLATETEAFSLDKSERENRRDLIEYYYHNRAILNHDIEIIRGEDIRSFLWRNGERGRAITRYMKGHKVPFGTWIGEYNFPALRVHRSGGGWIKEQMNERNPLEIQTIKYRITGEDIKEQIKAIRERQAGGVTIQILQTLFGLPDPIRSDEEIRRKVSDIMDDDTEGEIIEQYIREGKIRREDLDY